MPRQHRSRPAPVPPSLQRPPDFEQLRRFLAVARASGFTTAARQLGIAQPAVSRSVAELERDLGKKLIERTSRRFVITAAGQRLADECTALFERASALRAALEDQEVDVRGALRIGATEALAAHLLPRTLSSLAARFPRVHPFVVVAPTADLVARLASSDLDVVLTFHARPHAGVVQRQVAAFRFHVMSAPGRLADARTCEAFLGSREVEDEREHAFPVLAAWRARWPKARIVASTNSVAAHVALVREGFGVSILPELATSAELAAGSLVRAPGMGFTFGMNVVRRRKESSPVVDAIISIASAVAGGLPGAVG